MPALFRFKVFVVEDVCIHIIIQMFGACIETTFNYIRLMLEIISSWYMNTFQKSKRKKRKALNKTRFKKLSFQL